MHLERKKDLKELIKGIDQYSVYKYYIPSISINHPINSPFRIDKNPSFFLYVGQDGNPRHRDMGDDRWRGDCFNMVEQLFNLDIVDACIKILTDFGVLNGNSEQYQKVLNSYVKPVLTPKRHALLQCTTKAFTNSELKDYWGRYKVINLPKLKKHNVYSIKEAFLNRNKIPIGEREMVFGYWYENGWKLMFPERPKKQKWISNIPLDTPEGLSNLDKNHNSLLVKSKKCFMVMEEIYPYLCSFQNEGLGSVTQKTALYINENSNKVFYGGDSDFEGKKASYRITSAYSWNHINIPDKYLPKKDWSDWVEIEDTKAVENHLKIKGVII